MSNHHRGLAKPGTAIPNKFAIGLRGDRIVILNAHAMRTEGLDRKDVLLLIGWLCVMAQSLPNGKPVSQSEIDLAVGEVLA